MTKNSLPPDDSWESDAVWNLIDQAPAPAVSPRFADDTLRAVRLAENKKPVWQRFFSPLSVGFAGAAVTAAIVLSLVFQTKDGSNSPLDYPAQTAANQAEIQEFAETEVLLTAVDHLDDFSDHELASLIGF